MKTEDIRSAGSGEIRCYFWEPEGEAVGAVQLVHGIAEHALRYAPFAEFLAGKGFYVCAEDHMGHGESVGEDCPKGCVRGGWDAMVSDVNALSEVLKARFPTLPRFLLGHSMGSFLARTCLYTCPEAGWQGAVLSGTAWQPGPILAAGRAITKGEVRKQGPDASSPKLQALMFGSYTKQFESVRTPSDWICSDPAVVDAYQADPLCGFIPSGGLIAAMLEGLQRNQKAENLQKMPKGLPVLFIAGNRDPVGANGKGVTKSAEAFRKAGMKKVGVKLYPGDRHEVLNEVNKAEVWSDVLTWLRGQMN
ncbi:MAG: lysophospholipase [Oscillospiraceae bacterium]|nr:lysophospholipase [Oscillospiraceae bacterium]